MNYKIAYFKDGIPVQLYDHKFLHEKIALVSQEPVLYGRTITDNINYGICGKIDQSQTTDAAMKSNAHGFIIETADGYSTRCGQKGSQMSGGQKQRIAIARALVLDKDITICNSLN